MEPAGIDRPARPGEHDQASTGGATSVLAETERVTGGVEKHAESRARLHVGLDSAKFDDGRLSLVEIVHLHVQMHLLRN